MKKLIALAIALPAWLPSAAASQCWTTQPEFEIGNEPGTHASLWFVSSVRVSGADSRVFVTESQGARRVTVWTPPGVLLLELGPGGETEGLGTPRRVRVDSAGFWVWYGRHFGRFSEDGILLETLSHPPVEREAISLLADRSFLVRGRLPPPTIRMGWTGEEPVWERPLLHVSETEGIWTTDTIAVLDTRHSILGIRSDDGSGPFPTGYFSRQPFADHDLMYFEPEGGGVGIVKRNLGPGEVDIREVGAGGETVLHRRISLRPQSVEPGIVEETVKRVMETVLGSPAWKARPVSEATARQLVEEALYAPEYRPAVTQAVATGSGDLWLRSSEMSDTLTAWYSVRRIDPESAPRCVLLPNWFRLEDATRSHVWGVWMNSRGASQVLGRRLIPGP